MVPGGAAGSARVAGVGAAESAPPCVAPPLVGNIVRGIGLPPPPLDPPPIVALATGAGGSIRIGSAEPGGIAGAPRGVAARRPGMLTGAGGVTLPPRIK